MCKYKSTARRNLNGTKELIPHMQKMARNSFVAWPGKSGIRSSRSRAGSAEHLQIFLSQWTRAYSWIAAHVPQGIRAETEFQSHPICWSASVVWTRFLYQEAGRYLSPLLNSLQNLICLFWKQNMYFYAQPQHVIQTRPKLAQEWLEENFSRFWPLAWDLSLCFLYIHAKKKNKAL